MSLIDLMCVVHEFTLDTCVHVTVHTYVGLIMFKHKPTKMSPSSQNYNCILTEHKAPWSD